MRIHRPTAAGRSALTSAIAADRRVAQRVLWLAAGVLALGWLVAVRAAFGDSARGADAVRPGAAARNVTVARVPAERDIVADVVLRSIPVSADASAPGALTEQRVIPLRATLRAAERTRRAAGRTGVSARRDTDGHDAVVVTADAALALARGAAPEQAGTTAAAPQRGIHACGVRGPPEFLASLG